MEFEVQMNSLRPDEARVLVMYMPDGYVPRPFFLTETDSLFSNATSMEGSGVWLSSGTSSPVTPKLLNFPNILVTQHPTSVVHWIHIFTEIELNYTTFDAFILTEAQIPLSQLQNDAVDSLLGALAIAGNYIISGSFSIWSHLLGSKVPSFDLNALYSSNFPPLINVGIDTLANWSNVLRQTRLHRFRAHRMTLWLFPRMTDSTACAFLAALAWGITSKKLVVLELSSMAISQCYWGIHILSLCMGWVGYCRVGVVPSGDITPRESTSSPHPWV
ncbi:hypothetical protein BKA83DRAFT_4466262 [Pisolithus microcarpus]|nr:hypothetical protein BKA83DRAFT_4466262 [Pisolithus microcarpus]